MQATKEISTKADAGGHGDVEVECKI
jgi:hypothetical protein